MLYNLWIKLGFAKDSIDRLLITHKIQSINQIFDNRLSIIKSPLSVPQDRLPTITSDYLIIDYHQFWLFYNRQSFFEQLSVIGYKQIDYQLHASFKHNLIIKLLTKRLFTLNKLLHYFIKMIFEKKTLTVFIRSYKKL